ncbi:MAG: hypothetical protein PHE55_15655 [Methylococcaceae bacterium]|nr:hypothetical protein [Methylococcaceae bacterium]
MKTIETVMRSGSPRGKVGELWDHSAPWLAGVGIAVGHIALANNCTVPQQGRCGACGSCIVAVGSLVGWALLKQRRGEPFYTDDGSFPR